MIPLTRESQLDRLLEEAELRGARPFFALPNLVLHHLTFTQFFDTDTLDFRVMEEQIASPLVLDKAKTSILDQSLDRTLWHFCTPKKEPGRTAALAMQQTVALKKGKADKATKLR
jgi:hypothetical protein